MEPFAEASCILRMNIDCEACKMKVMEVLSSIIGVYSVDIDAKQGRVKVFGEVDPNTLLKALARTGRHAKLEWAKLNHPLINRTYHGDLHGSYNYGYNSAAALEDAYGYGRALPGSAWHDGHHDHYYPMTRLAPDYPSYGTNYYSDYGPTGRHVPSFPPPIYDPYQDDSINLCNIM